MNSIKIGKLLLKWCVYYIFYRMSKWCNFRHILQPVHNVLNMQWYNACKHTPNIHFQGYNCNPSNIYWDKYIFMISTSLHNSDQFITGCKYVVNWLANRCVWSDIIINICWKNLIVRHHDANVNLTSKTSCEDIRVCWEQVLSDKSNILNIAKVFQTWIGFVKHC